MLSTPISGTRVEDRKLELKRKLEKVETDWIRLANLSSTRLLVFTLDGSCFSIALAQKTLDGIRLSMADAQKNLESRMIVVIGTTA